jgi:Flp pilus assembly protein TadG
MRATVSSIIRRLAGHESGQVLPLFALFVIVLFGMAALAIDVSRAYADLRFHRAAADAAALAGAQDLQAPGSRAVTAAERAAALGHALESLEQRLGGSGAGCVTTATQVGPCMLAGRPYEVTITSPSPSCADCSPERSVQVTVRHPNYGLTFARALGSNEWDLGTTSVAGLVYGKAYTIITLRPPKKLGSTFDVKDITIDGGSRVDVDQGDVGSNANMNYSGSGSILTLDPGYEMFFFPAPPPDEDQGWYPAGPTGTPNTTLINDPNYRYPLMTGSLGTAPTYDDARTSQYATLPAVERADVDAACLAESAKLDVTRYTFIATQPLDTIYCYNPGIYQSGSGAKNATITAGTGEVALLKPGSYYLKNGMDISGRLIGGYEPGSPGIAVMFDEAGPGNCSSCVFVGNNALSIALNAGTRFPATFGGGVPATAARDWDNQLVETSGPMSPTPPLPLTMLVKKDSSCTVPTSAPFVEPSACNASRNQTINIFGNGDIVLGGVQYMPTDNVTIGGSSSSNGRVGQIISWTLKYSGGIHINQEGPGTEGNGILRIDSACSAPGEPCTHP